MKRGISISLAVLVITFAGTLSLLTVTKTRERNSYLGVLSSSLETLVTIELSGIRDGYFVWTEFFESLERRGPQAVRAELDEIEATYPYILEATVEAGAAPDTGTFVIRNDGRDIIAAFPIRTSDSAKTLGGYFAQVKLDTRKILADLQSPELVQVRRRGSLPFAFDLRAEYTGGLLAARDYALAVFAALAVFLPTLIYLRRRTSFFYESRGLESIIFLFEQAERFSSNHSRRVASLSAFIGMQVGLSGRRLRDLYIAALLHDIGKLSIPREILMKRGALTPQEYAIVQGHPLSSARILSNFRELSHLRPFVLYHHERMDGSGYPEGIWGTAIPLESRIISVADVFEALVGERPYRTPMPIEEAFEHLRSISLDQEVVETLVVSYKDFGEYKLPKWVLRCQYSPFEMRARDVYELERV